MPGNEIILGGPAAVRRAVLRLAKAATALADCVGAIDRRQEGRTPVTGTGLLASASRVDVSQRLKEAVYQIELAVDELEGRHHG